MSDSNKRPMAVLHVKLLQKINDFIAKMLGIALNMETNVALFPNPIPTIATFRLHIMNLIDANAKVQTGLRTAVPERNIAKEVVLDDIHHIINYVQNLADAAADYVTAIDIIMASGLDVKSEGVHKSFEFTAKNGIASGIVNLTAESAGTHAAYEWEMSTDQINWTKLPTTLVAKTTVSGLTRASIVYFRYKSITKKGESGLSYVVALVIN